MEQIKIDLVPNGVMSVAHASQFDVGRSMKFLLTDEGVTYTLAGTEVITMKLRKPDGTDDTISLVNTSSSYVEWTTVDGDLDLSGVYLAEITITSGDDVIGTANFLLKVESDPYDGKNVRTVTVGPADICTFETNLPEPLQSVKCSINPIQNGTPWIDSNEVNKEPYIKRAVAGTATRIGNHLYDKLVGGTVAFNQLVNTPVSDASVTTDGIYFTDNRDGSFTLKTDNGGATSTTNISVEGLSIPQNHKVIVLNSFSGTSVSTHRFFCSSVGSNTYFNNGDSVYNISDLTVKLYFQVFSGDEVLTEQTVKPNIINLTAMFGSTIADYIYGLEQATAGAGVAWFKALFPNDYYAYNAGELMSVKATAHIMRNASNTVIGNYPLDSNLELRGIPKLVNNKLEYDGDTYESNGSVTRKYGIVDLGSLDWLYRDDNVFSCNVSELGYEKSNYTLAICGVYAFYKVVNSLSMVKETAPDKTISIYYNSATPNDSYLYVKDTTAGTDANAFKTAMSGVYLLYELATPTTEQASPFTNPQVCDENGTEEYTDNRAVAIPVGHETYQANICPINGYSSANITRCGVNLCSLLFTDGYVPSISNGTLVQAGGSRSDFIMVKPSTLYSFVIDASAQMLYMFYYDSAKTFIGNSNPTNITTSFTATTPANCKYIMLRTQSSYVDRGMLAEGTHTQYEPYNGQTITLSLGQTVYGGVLDVTRGKLKPCIEYPSYNGETLSGRWLSSEATYVEGTTPPTGSQVVSLDDYSSDIDLTPVQIRALVGENNVFADCGQTTVEYMAEE